MQPMLLQQMKSRSQLVYNKRLDAFTSLCTTLYEIILLCALAVSDSPSLVTRKRQALRAFASRSSRNPCLFILSDAGEEEQPIMSAIPCFKIN